MVRIVYSVLPADVYGEAKIKKKESEVTKRIPKPQEQYQKAVLMFG